MSYAPQQQYYGMPPQYPGGGVPSPTYAPYQTYGRSPPAMHQYIPMVGVSVPPNYPRPNQQSPNLATPYRPPPAPAPIPPQTPSSTHSSQTLTPPTPPTPQTAQRDPSQSQPRPQPTEAPQPTGPRKPVVVLKQQPFRPPLPWFSRPDALFPQRSRRSRTKRRLLPLNEQPISFLIEQREGVTDSTDAAASKAVPTEAKPPTSEAAESDSKPAVGAHTSQSPTASCDATPALSETAPEEGRGQNTNGHSANSAPNGEGSSQSDKNAMAEDVKATDERAIAPAPPVKAAPTSWANLFAKPAAQNVTSLNSISSTTSVNGDAVEAATVPDMPGSKFSQANRSLLGEAIRSFKVDRTEKATLIEPRGLVNTGNMCYMNSVLQVLMFCAPFYDFLDQVSKRAAHSFKSETPLVDAMVMFLQEFKVLASASSSKQLRSTLKSQVFELYGEPFTPEFVYEAIRQLPRFASMRRGHQQDAEEFLGFLLQSLDDECTLVMNKSFPGETEQVPDEKSIDHEAAAPSGDWLEVGRKQKAAVSRSSGSNTSSPITKIFGGLLRSEFRVPGLKDSITTEPYQPLQLDIGSPDVRNVVDALRGLTRPERLQGDFNSPRGKDVLATKQVFIESLPPVLILHLKRFQFDATANGTIKIWKKIGYPLELEIPREALSRQRRQNIGDGPLPRYKLISVVYHHGKNASGGHYTVDVRRQDGQEWIRMDDTVLQRIRSEEVARIGAEEEVKDTRKEQNSSASASANRFGAMDDEDSGDKDGWKQVTTSASGGKRWSSVVNSANAPSQDKQVKDNIKDNKVAYLLFYQRM
ncbi:hypothetical protein H634G_08268 [Metarhizium anisopliae BRIP 53293]|uniref:Ubiquitin carboxyl-terminal hydrolase n=1 Tax=Metarhizium anisopliae BRIP 53293 TaxID=1291518 RepID=A0A0D9NQQ3_METAN|nr:hypothetical protein H634G_08268 [Metarhizium anisopliae BRIP 53293]KJK94171.1 hypothetical protein H633G_01964 [Metarhizium anisopliae BRIP 53284]